MAVALATLRITSRYTMCCIMLTTAARNPKIAQHLNMQTDNSLDADPPNHVTGAEAFLDSGAPRVHSVGPNPKSFHG